MVSFAGAEQEYFLIDRNFFFARPDLIASGRTLFGAPPPKGQEFDDHYFGAIPERVLAFMLESERELFKLGIPVKTRHNEVAPGQFEMAPVFEQANLATDHQQLMMVTLKRVAEKYGMTCLLHEKPFAGVNGSGKHVNFSIGNATQGNLLDPGDTPHENAQFLVFCAAVIRAVHKYRGAAARRGGLGGQRPPPRRQRGAAGDHLDLPRRAARGRLRADRSRASATSSASRGTLTVGVDTLPPLPKDAGDRNRTSPFAFTGNRFEFRAVGAEPVDRGAAGGDEHDPGRVARLHRQRAGGGGRRRSERAARRRARRCCEDIIERTASVIFNGDGYSEAWHAEADERGLPNLRTTVDALPVLGQRRGGLAVRDATAC